MYPTSIQNLHAHFYVESLYKLVSLRLTPSSGLSCVVVLMKENGAMKKSNMIQLREIRQLVLHILISNSIGIMHFGF